MQIVIQVEIDFEVPGLRPKMSGPGRRGSLAYAPPDIACGFAPGFEYGGSRSHLAWPWGNSIVGIKESQVFSQRT